MKDFDDYLCQREDDVDNAAYALLCAVANRQLDWDLSIIRPLVEEVANILEDLEIGSCVPYYDDDGFERRPCYEDEFVECANCPMRA